MSDYKNKSDYTRSQRIAIFLNEFRVFPRMMMAFMMFMLYRFHEWFTMKNSIPVTDMSEWAIVGYATVLATFVGFSKFYMDTRGDRDNIHKVEEKG